MAGVTPWIAQAGSQVLFLTCPIFEVLMEGTRGGGKTDCLLIDFLQHVGKGYGPDWRGILFRRTYKQLSDVVAKSHRLVKGFGLYGGSFNKSDYYWQFKGGEVLFLRYMDDPNDYWNYHGWELPWIGWEELTNWPSDECYESMKSCCRSSNAHVPRRYRSTCNPYGVGHSWVKGRFIDPAPAGTVIVNAQGQKRVRIHSSIHENKVLMQADPEYLKNLQSLDDENKRKAWLEGDWNIVAGAMFGDQWNPKVHIIPPFTIPKSWTVNRSFDWGSSKPFSVGWWAESDGSEVQLSPGVKRTFPRGTLFRIAEYYGWNGKPNEGTRQLAVDVARTIVEMEAKLPFKVQPGPADTSIFDVENGKSIADDMARVGVRWTRADKSPGSRVQGWETIRKLMKASLQCPMEEPGLFIFDTCRHFIRTVPAIPMDDMKLDDVDTDAEDHVADEARYRCMTARREVQPVTNWGG